MVDAVADLVDGGRVKLYCVGSRRGIVVQQRHSVGGAHAGTARESWIFDQVVPWIFDDCQGPADILTTGTSMGAYHAANFALKRADLFPQALCMSGNYDLSYFHGWGERGDSLYFNSPLQYVATRRPPGLAPVPGVPCLCAGRGCGRTPPARWKARRRSADSSPRRASRTRWICGATTWHTTGRGGGDNSPTTCRDSADPIAPPSQRRRSS